MSKLRTLFDDYLENISSCMKKYLLLIISSIGLLSLLFSWIVVKNHLTVQLMLIAMKLIFTLPLMYLTSLIILSIALIVRPKVFTNFIKRRYELVNQIGKIYVSSFYLFYLLVSVFIFSGSIYLISNFNIKDLLILIISSCYLLGILIIMSMGAITLFAALKTIIKVETYDLQKLIVAPFVNFCSEFIISFLFVVNPKVLLKDFRKFYFISIAFSFYLALQEKFLVFRAFINDYFFILAGAYLAIGVGVNIYLAKRDRCFHQKKASGIRSFIKKNGLFTRTMNLIVVLMFLTYILLSVFYWLAGHNHMSFELIFSQAAALTMMAFGYSTANQALSRLILLIHMNKLKLKD